ncbi:rab guanine nucleotide exchange factor S2 [Rhizina undulata]
MDRKNAQLLAQLQDTESLLSSHQEQLAELKSVLAQATIEKATIEKATIEKSSDADLCMASPSTPLGHRHSKDSIGSQASPSPSNYSPPTFPPHLTHNANKCESKMLRKSSHKRAHTNSSTSAFSTPSRTGTPQSVDQGWDGVSLQDGRMGDVTRTTPEKKRSTFSTFRDLATTLKLAGFGGGVSSGSPGEREPHNRTTSMSSNSTTGSTHSNSNSTNTKKTVSWDLPTAEAVPSTPRKMPPCHPPPESWRALIEEELSEHFRQHSIASLPAVAPLKITKSPTSPSRTMSIDSASTTPRVPECSTTYPTTREYGPRLPSRPNYVEPHKQEPTQHNKVRYTTNAMPLPSPPMSGSGESPGSIEDMLRRPKISRWTRVWGRRWRPGDTYTLFAKGKIVKEEAGAHRVDYLLLPESEF